MKPICLVTVNVKKTLYGHTADNLSAIAPNIPMLMIDSYLSSKNIPVVYLDSDALNLSINELIDKLEKINPCLIGVVASGANPSASTMSMVGVIKFFSEYNSKKIDIPTFILGGHPTVLPRRSLIETKSDFVILGEGYEAITGLYDYLIKGKKLSSVPGIAYFKNGDYIANKAPDLIDLGEIPMINWNKADPTKYRAHNWHCFDNIDNRMPYAIIWTNQGCPYPCDFCSINNVFGKRRYRLRTMESVVNEIDILVNKFEIRNLKILDELFIVKHKRIERFCELLEERKYDLNMWCFARTDTVSPDILKRLKGVGVNWVAYGFESFNEDIVNSTNKRLKRQGDFSTENTIKMTKDAGINICADLIAGLWDDDEKSIHNTRDFMIKHLFEWVNIYPCFAYPGTPLYDNYLKEGRIQTPTNWETYGLYSYECNPLPTHHLKSSEVLRLRDNVFHDYFTNPEILNMLEKKFGTKTKNHVQTMTKKPLKRRLLEEQNLQIQNNTKVNEFYEEEWFSKEIIV